MEDKGAVIKIILKARPWLFEVCSQHKVVLRHTHTKQQVAGLMAKAFAKQDMSGPLPDITRLRRGLIPKVSDKDATKNASTTAKPTRSKQGKRTARSNAKQMVLQAAEGNKDDTTVDVPSSQFTSDGSERSAADDLTCATYGLDNGNSDEVRLSISKFSAQGRA